MTEKEFRKQLDDLVMQGIRRLGAGTVYGQICVVKQYTEVLYDTNILSLLNIAQFNNPKGADE